MAVRDLPPETIVDGRYSIMTRIGSGGMAEVYCANDLQLGRKVALKLLHRRFAEDGDFVERFRREASSAAGLQHPNVVGVYDRGEWEGTYYIAMEYLEGRSLKEVLNEHGPLPAGLAIHVTEQILRAARFAHQRGIIHRDLKPHNVIVDDEWRVRVTDFGIARAGASDMTETGSIMGTAQYLSPEQAQGHAVSAASDIYAIGILLYELLAGRVPFDGDSAVTIALKQVSEAPVPPSVHNPAVPPELDAIVLRALEKEPADRFADAEEFIVALQRTREHLAAVEPGQSTAVFGALPAAAYPDETDPTAIAPLAAEPTDEELAALAYPAEPPPPESEEERRRRRLRWAVAIAVLLLLAAAALTFALTRPESKPLPNVVGTQLSAAAAVLRNQGFEVDVERVTSPVGKDTVLRQDPQPRTEVDEGSTVTLTVSDGPGDALVPDVVRLSQREAERALREAGFKVTVKREPSETIPEGRAARTSPSSGVRAEKGALVTLFVSSGAEQVSVPDVTGQSEGSARSELVDAGLRADISEEESDEEAGTVIRQSPAAGTSVDKGASVSVVIARERRLVTVPDVTGRQRAEASSTLSGAGLSVVIVERPVTDEAQDGIVQSQSPSEGSRVPAGSRVSVVVGTFTPADEPPGGGTPPASGQ